MTGMLVCMVNEQWRDYPCDIWEGSLAAGGYGRVFYQGKRWLVHRLAWTQENGPIPNGMNVLHHCDNRPCREVHHLFLGTQVDNMADMVSKGRSPDNVGRKNPNAKFDEDDVREIRHKHAEGNCTYKQLGIEYDTTAENISFIVRRIHWGHVQ